MTYPKSPISPEERAEKIRRAAYGFSQGESPVENAIHEALHQIRQAENDALERAAEFLKTCPCLDEDGSILQTSDAIKHILSLRHKDTP